MIELDPKNVKFGKDDPDLELELQAKRAQRVFEDASMRYEAMRRDARRRMWQTVVIGLLWVGLLLFGIWKFVR